MKSLRIILIGLLVALFLIGCAGPPEGNGETQEAATEPAAGAGTEAFQVAVVMPSGITDAAFSQSMYDALVLIQNEMGEENFEIAYSENMFVVEDAAAAIRDYASQGYDLVIAHGSQYGASLQEIAPDFPSTSFAWGTTVDTFGQPNIFAYEARSEEGGYVNGVMAAMMSQSNVLGVIGPIETGDAKLYVDGFAAGARSVKPDINVRITYTGDFADTGKAAEAATTHLGAGADGLTGTAQMVVGAIGVGKENGIPWWGTQSNQTSLAPEIVVASQVYHWEVVLHEMINLVQGGTLGGQSFEINLSNGGEVIEYNPDYAVDPGVVEAANQAIDGIKGGTITIELPTE